MHVRVRETGQIGPDDSRQSGFSPTLVMQVSSSYMDAASEEFGIKVPKGRLVHLTLNPIWRLRVRGRRSVPRLIQGTVRVLGRLAWLAQTPAWTSCTILYITSGLTAI